MQSLNMASEEQYVRNHTSRKRGGPNQSSTDHPFTAVYMHANANIIITEGCKGKSRAVKMYICLLIKWEWNIEKLHIYWQCTYSTGQMQWFQCRLWDKALREAVHAEVSVLSLWVRKSITAIFCRSSSESHLCCLHSSGHANTIQTNVCVCCVPLLSPLHFWSSLTAKIFPCCTGQLQKPSFCMYYCMYVIFLMQFSGVWRQQSLSVPLIVSTCETSGLVVSSWPVLRASPCCQRLDFCLQHTLFGFSWNTWVGSKSYMRPVNDFMKESWQIINNPDFSRSCLLQLPQPPSVIRVNLIPDTPTLLSISLLPPLPLLWPKVARSTVILMALGNV